MLGIDSPSFEMERELDVWSSYELSADSVNLPDNHSSRNEETFESDAWIVIDIDSHNGQLVQYTFSMTTSSQLRRERENSCCERRSITSNKRIVGC